MFISVYKGKWVKTQLPIEKIKKKNKKKYFLFLKKWVIYPLLHGRAYKH